MATTIQINKDVREKLKLFGHKAESYSDIIERLMAYSEELNIEELIDERWDKLQKEKDQYMSLAEV